MFFRVLLVCLMLTSLYAKEKSWQEKIYISVEAGMHMSEFDGTLTNETSSASFRDDFGYSDVTTSSYFALGLMFDYDYVPNIGISYFNDQQNTNMVLNKKIQVADKTFDVNSSVVTDIAYQVLNVVIYEDFKTKGSRVKFFKWNIYPGDIEFDVGINLKVIDWKYQIRDAATTGASTHWVRVEENIPLPYIGFKYYYYRFRAYANISSLSFSDAKSTNYEMGVDFRLVDELYISASYLYEDFEAVEKKDTVKFQTSGNKFSFKYIF